LGRHVVVVKGAVRRHPVGLEFRTARLETLGFPLTPLEVEARLPHALLKTWNGQVDDESVVRCACLMGYDGFVSSGGCCSNPPLVVSRGRHVRHAQTPHASVFNVSFFEPINPTSWTTTKKPISLPPGIALPPPSQRIADWRTDVVRRVQVCASCASCAGSASASASASLSARLDVSDSHSCQRRVDVLKKRT